jgi:hypothetical protein
MPPLRKRSSRAAPTIPVTWPSLDEICRYGEPIRGFRAAGAGAPK